MKRGLGGSAHPDYATRDVAIRVLAQLFDDLLGVRDAGVPCDLDTVPFDLDGKSLGKETVRSTYVANSPGAGVRPL